MLTAKQIDRYHSDGFLVIADFASAAACDRLRARANEIVAAWEPGEERSVSNGEFLTSGSSTWCFFEEEAFDDTGSLRQAKELSINKIGHAQHDTDDEFRQFAYNPDLGAVARDLGMSDPRALQSMYIFKQPRIGGEVSVHQDATFLWTDPLSVIGFWFALEDATIDNMLGGNNTIRRRPNETNVYIQKNPPSSRRRDGPSSPPAITPATSDDS